MHQVKEKRFLALIISFLVISTIHTLSLKADEPSKSDTVFLSYVNGSGVDLNYDLYTHLCHAFITANKDGSLIPNELVPDRQLTADSHKHGVEVFLSLGGWGWDANFLAIVMNPEAEDRYISSVLEIVDEFDYDGIDLDWEYPDSREEMPGFDRLARRFREGLEELGKRKERSMKLTMAVSAHPKTLVWLSNKMILENFDWINVMTYDYSGNWSDFAGHHSPLSTSSQTPKDENQSIETSINYLIEERKLPTEKILLGLPLYARGFNVASPYCSTEGVQTEGLDVKRYYEIPILLKNGWQRTWDNETKTPWLHSPSGLGVIGYDDKESIAIKTKWAREKKLRGVFFWEASQDRMSNKRNPLQEAAHDIWYRMDSLDYSQ